MSRSPERSELFLRYKLRDDLSRYRYCQLDLNRQNDELLINGLNICTPALCPVSKLVNAYFAFNWEGKEETTLNPDPVTGALPFIQGAQVYIPASSPPNAIVKYQLNSRGGGGLRTLNIPNWEGTTDQVTIYWNDFESLNF